MEMVTTTTQKPNLACPKCGSVAMKTRLQRFKDNSEHVRGECGRCGKFLRYVRKDQARVEYDRRDNHPAYTPVPPGTRWVAWLRQDNQLWHPVAVCSSLEAAWDAVHSSWQKGDVLVTPETPATTTEEDNHD